LPRCVRVGGEVVTVTKQDDDVVVEEGRVMGCRGRALIGLIILGVLLVILIVMLVRGMFGAMPPPPPPA
jgi:hypothetical protein